MIQMLNVSIVTEPIDVNATQDMQVMEKHAEVRIMFIVKSSLL